MDLIEKWIAKKREKELLKEIKRLNEEVHRLETLLEWERFKYRNTQKSNIQEVECNCLVPKEEEKMIGEDAIEYAKENIACNILKAIRPLIEVKLRGNDWNGNKIYTGSLRVDTRGKQLDLICID